LRGAADKPHRITRFAPGAALLAAGAAPLVLAGTAWHLNGHGGLDGSGLTGECPLLESTGIPCAGCGASRAFYFLTHGDGAFLDYNWVWPLVAVAAIAYGLLLTWRAWRRRPLLARRARAGMELYMRRPVVSGVATSGLLLIPWAVALLNVEAIRVY
jgi:Protein of unknown function (DUF2752)